MLDAELIIKTENICYLKLRLFLSNNPSTPLRVISLQMMNAERSRTIFG
jgi:hypothetical protein